MISETKNFICDLGIACIYDIYHLSYLAGLRSTFKINGYMWFLPPKNFRRFAAIFYIFMQKKYIKTLESPNEVRISSLEPAKGTPPVHRWTLTNPFAELRRTILIIFGLKWSSWFALDDIDFLRFFPLGIPEIQFDLDRSIDFSEFNSEKSMDLSRSNWISGIPRGKTLKK